MYHSVTFGDKNSWDDWHLIPSSRPTVSMPQPRSKWVDVPGVDGQINLYDELYGVPIYGNREGTFEFVIRDYMHRSWEQLYTEIANHLHGRSMTMVLEDDPDFYYEGYFTLDAFKAGASASAVTIGYHLKPYKFPKDEDYDNWDPTVYDTNQMRAIKRVRVAGEGTVRIQVNRSHVFPSFLCSAPMEATVNGKTIHLPRGWTPFVDVVLNKGEHTVTLKGTGRVTIDFRGGTL